MPQTPKVQPEGMLSPAERETVSAISILGRDKRTLNRNWGPAQAFLLEAAARDPQVERIFITAPAKLALCADAGPGDAAWLRKVRPWWGHDDHMHVRLNCPRGVAGCVQPIFTPRAIQTLHRLSGGIPRLINLICDRALIAAFARGSHKIVHGDISQSAYEVSGIRDEGSWQSGLTVALVGALLVATGWWGWQFFGFFPARPLVKVEVPVKVDDTPEQQAQLTRAINQALEPDVAMQNLYKVWGYQAELEEATCDNAPRAGLRCQEGEASLAQLQALQYPALISLTDETGGLYYATLVSLGADKASLLIGNQSWQVDRQWLSDAWGGSYTLLWRMPRGNVPLIASNAGAAQVQWLDNALSRAMQQPDRKVSRFDATLKNKLQQFQREQGLTPDGIAGSNTLLRLNVASGEPMPRLEDESLRASTPVDLDSVADDETDPMVEEAS